MNENLTLTKKKCPFCNSLNILPMEAGHVVGVGEPLREINKIQFQCSNCKKHFWMSKDE
jgi:uncharacterized protein with PIN domain